MTEDEQWKRQKKAFDEANYHRQQGERGYRTSHTASDEGYKNYEKRQRQTNNNSAICFSACTPVLTPQGWMKISDLTVDHEVLSLTKAGQLRARDVQRIKGNKSSRLWTVETEFEEHSIKCTAGHPFLTTAGWKWAWSLRPGDELAYITADMELKQNRVVEVSRTEIFEPVFNLVTAQEHNFIVRGAVAHNFGFMRDIRSWASSLVSEAQRKSTIRPPANA